MENYLKFTDKTREEFDALLVQNGFKCDAAGRAWMAEQVGVLFARPVNLDMELISYAEEVGGLPSGTEIEYPNASGGISKAVACSLYELPRDMVNPYLYCFSGMMSAPFYAMEALRFHFKRTGELLPFVSSGKGGNKGLFAKLFERPKGLVIKTEYDAYCAVMAMLAGRDYAYQNYREHDDTDTLGNLAEIYAFAKEKGLKEITLVLCTGNPFYDKRLLAEWMLELKKEAYREVKINLVLAHCPVFITFNRISIPEMRLSEIYAGYIAASLGPLMKDTISFEGETSSKKPERYLMDGVKDADWGRFYDLIVNYSNMGWPDYQEILYGIPHEEAVGNVLLADVFARNSFNPLDYDFGLQATAARYQKFIGEAFAYNPECRTLGEYLKNTTDKKFF